MSDAKCAALSAVPMDLYVRDGFGDHPPSLSSSVAHKLLTRSPRHAWIAHARLNPVWAPHEEGRFDLGSAAHAVLLEGRGELIHVVQATDWRKKETQAERDAARAAGKLPLLADQAADVAQMVEVARRKLATSPDLRGIALDALEPELTFLWREGKAQLRCRTDWITRERDLVLSYKTTAGSAEPDAFTRGILLNSGYDLQAEFESRAVEALTGTLPKYVWLVQEVEPPYACSLLGYSPQFSELAAMKFARAVSLWTSCLRANEWPGYPDQICWMLPPPWAMTQFAERHGFTDRPTTTTTDDGRPLADQLIEG